ncbi:MAG: hypothetical protein RLZZ440_2118, partial [Planctomycetota bacterium]
VTSATPELSASARVSIWGDGRLTLQPAIGVDNTESVVTVAGRINAGADGRRTFASIPANGPSATSNGVMPTASHVYAVTAAGGVTDAAGLAVDPTVRLSVGQVVRLPGGDLYQYGGPDNAWVTLSAATVTSSGLFGPSGASVFSPAAAAYAATGQILLTGDFETGDVIMVTGATPGGVPVTFEYVVPAAEAGALPADRLVAIRDALIAVINKAPLGRLIVASRSKVADNIVELGTPPGRVVADGDEAPFSVSVSLALAAGPPRVAPPRAEGRQLRVGDWVTLSNADDFWDYRGDTLSDGTTAVRDSTGRLVDTMDLRVGTVVRWIDGLTYYFVAATSLPAATPTSADFTDTDRWAVLPEAQAGTPYQITAILPVAGGANGDAGRHEYVLAEGQPLNLDNRTATGANHEVFFLTTRSFDGSSGSVVDLGRDEILLKDPTVEQVDQVTLAGTFTTGDRLAVEVSSPDGLRRSATYTVPALAPEQLLRVTGTFAVGDTILLAFTSPAGAATNLSYTVASEAAGSVRDGLITAINGLAGVGTGPQRFLAATPLADDPQGIRLLGSTAGSAPFTVSAVVTTAGGGSRAVPPLVTAAAVTEHVQQVRDGLAEWLRQHPELGGGQRTVVSLAGTWSVGDRIDLTITPTAPASSPIPVSLTVTDPSLSAIRTALIAAVNATAGLGAAADALLRADVDPLDPSGLLLAASRGGVGYSLSQVVTRGRESTATLTLTSLPPLFVVGTSTKAAGVLTLTATAGSTQFRTAVVASGSGAAVVDTITGGAPTFTPGQIVSYYVMQDAQNGVDGAAIGGLTADTDFNVVDRGWGRIALAATPDDALANRVVDLTSLGGGSRHLIRFEQGRTRTLGLTSRDLDAGAAEATAGVRQVDQVVLAGSYRDGDTVDLVLASADSGDFSDFITHTVAVRSEWQLNLTGTFQAGDTIQVSVTPSSGPAIPVSITVGDPTLAAVRTALIDAINDTAGLGMVPAALLTASAEPTAGVIRLLAEDADKPFTVTATVTAAASPAPAITATAVTQTRRQVRDDLIASINDALSFTYGDEAYVVASADPASEDAVLLTARTPGSGFATLVYATNRATPQQEEISLSGDWQAGDTVTVRLTSTGPQPATIAVSTTAGGSDVKEIREALLNALLSTDGVGYGDDSYLLIVAGDDDDSILLTAADPDAGFSVTVSVTEAAPSATIVPADDAAAVEIQLAGRWVVGDVIELSIDDDDPATAPITVQSQVTSTEVQEVRNALLADLEASSAVGVVAAAATPLPNGIRLTPQAGVSLPSVTATVQITAREPRSSPPLATITRIASADVDSDDTQAVTFSEVTSNRRALNLVDQVFGFAAEPGEARPRGLVDFLIVTLAGGLVSMPDGELFGADAFLSAGGVLYDGAGQPVAGATLLLEPGDVLYFESLATGVLSAAYLRYTGVAGTFDAAGVGRLIRQGTSWSPAAGPQFYVREPGLDEADRWEFRLQAAAEGSSLTGARQHPAAQASLSLVVPQPYLFFDPGTAIDNANNVITLPGLTAAAADTVTFYADGEFFKPGESSLRTAVPAAGVQAGSNFWAGIELPASAVPVVAGGAVYEARYASTIMGSMNAGAGGTATSDPVGGLADFQQVFVAVDAAGAGLRFYQDAAGVTPLQFTAEPSANATHYLSFTVPTVLASRSPIGLSPGLEIQLIYLGADRFQLAVEEPDLVRATPRYVAGRQIASATRLVQVSAPALDGDNSQPATEATTTVVEAADDGAGTLAVRERTDGADGTFTLALTGQPVGSVVVYQRSTDGGATWATTTTSQVGLPAGSYRFRARVTSGGVTVTSNVIQAVVDQTGPVLTGLTSTSSQVTLTFNEAIDKTRLPDASSFSVFAANEDARTLELDGSATDRAAVLSATLSESLAGLSLAGWFNLDSDAAAAGPTVLFALSGSAGELLSVSWLPTNRLSLGFSAPGVGPLTVTGEEQAAANRPTGRFAHVAVTVSATGAVAFLIDGADAGDGTLAVPAGRQLSAIAWQRLLIGGTDQTATSGTLVGSLRDVRLYSTALSSTAVEALMNTAPSATDADLVRWFPLQASLADGRPASGASLVAYRGASTVTAAANLLTTRRLFGATELAVDAGSLDKTNTTDRISNTTATTLLVNLRSTSKVGFQQLVYVSYRPPTATAAKPVPAAIRDASGNEATELRNLVATNNASGVTLSASISAKNSVTGRGTVGSNPKLRDYARNPALLAGTASLGAGGFVGSLFGDRLKDQGFKNSTSLGGVNF